MNEYLSDRFPSDEEEHLISFPTSVRRMAELAPASAAQDARLAMAQVMAELARSQGDLAALVMAGQMGASGISRTRVEERHFVEKRERSFLGLSLGDEYVPTSETRSVSETWRLLR